ncbi:MAG: hypothetical protein L6U99_09630 [Clostridium sp.]|nr:MAG: hypothetical protein L6U99_09630 [Clostridium sp.]
MPIIIHNIINKRYVLSLSLSLILSNKYLENNETNTRHTEDKLLRIPSIIHL